MKVLMVLTSHDKLGATGEKTGFWLEEFAAPYYVFKDAGAQITLALSARGPASGGSQERIPEIPDRSHASFQRGPSWPGAARPYRQARHHFRVRL